MSETDQKTSPAEEIAKNTMTETHEAIKPAENGNKAAKQPEKANGSEVEAEKKEENGVKDPELHKKIIGQLEYYFGDYNLPRDKFLRAEIKKDDGWISLTTMLKFVRLAKLTTDAAVIAAAIKESSGSFMEVDSTGSKIRRSTASPLPDDTEGLNEEYIKRTIYCKGFAKDGSVTLDTLLEFFKQFGEYESIRMRKYMEKATNTSGFKGSVLVVFKTVEVATAFMDGPPTKYLNSYLIKKWFSKYLDEKKKEYEERQAKKAAKLQRIEESIQAVEDMPKGTFLKATGFAANTTREDIKAAVLELAGDCAFVDFKKGDAEAYIRFGAAGSNVTVLSALKDNLKVNGAAISLHLVEGEEEEAQLEKAKKARSRFADNSNKRKGGFKHRGNRAKRQRTD